MGVRFSLIFNIFKPGVESGQVPKPEFRIVLITLQNVGYFYSLRPFLLRDEESLLFLIYVIQSSKHICIHYVTSQWQHPPVFLHLERMWWIFKFKFTEKAPWLLVSESFTDRVTLTIVDPERTWQVVSLWVQLTMLIIGYESSYNREIRGELWDHYIW